MSLLHLYVLCTNYSVLVYCLTFYRPQRSWGKVIFSEACVKNSGGISRPTPRGGGWGVWSGGVSRSTPGGVRGLVGWSPDPHLGGGGSPGSHIGGFRPRGGCIPACTEADPHPSTRLLLRILLECILVCFCLYRLRYDNDISQLCWIRWVNLNKF